MYGTSGKERKRVKAEEECTEFTRQSYTCMSHCFKLLPVHATFCGPQCQLLSLTPTTLLVLLFALERRVKSRKPWLVSSSSSNNLKIKIKKNDEACVLIFVGGHKFFIIIIMFSFSKDKNNWRCYGRVGFFFFFSVLCYFFYCEMFEIFKTQIVNPSINWQQINERIKV